MVAARAVVQVNGQELDGPMAFEAWRLVACDYGLECGPESRVLDIACASRGFCRAGNVANFTYYYEATPSGAQLIDQYRRTFHQAVDSGDWTQVQATWRSNNPSNSYYVRGYWPP